MDSIRPSASASPGFDSVEDKVSELFVALRLPLYRYLLAGLGSSTEAEDLTQECFLRLYRHFREGHQLTDPRFWVFHVARNLVLDRNKSGRVTRETIPASWNDVVESFADSSLNPEDRLIEQERYETVHSALQELSIQQREVLAFKAEGLGYKEIAELMSLSTFAVAAHVRRAIAKIKTRLP